MVGVNRNISSVQRWKWFKGTVVGSTCMYAYRIANDATIEDEKSDIYIIDSGERRRWWQQSRRTEGWSDSGDRVVAREKFRLGRRWFAVILDSRGLISRGREKVYSAGKMQLDGMTVAYWGADATRRDARNAADAGNPAKIWRACATRASTWAAATRISLKLRSHRVPWASRDPRVTLRAETYGKKVISCISCFFFFFFFSLYESKIKF